MSDPVDMTVHAALASSGHASCEVPPGSVLVLYTDGLVEDRRRDIDDGIDGLRRTLVEDAADEVELLADRLVDAAERTGHDDQCLLVVRTP